MPSNVTIIDYGSGNLRSVAKAFDSQGARVSVSASPSDIAAASHIVLPGVGAFADCIGGLKAAPGVLPALEEQVHVKKKPFLGICVGMQMLFEQGHEHGTHTGLGWLKGQVMRLAPATALKIPHMGWNALSFKQPHPLFSGLEQGAHAYFVHSYHAACEAPSLLATTDYGQTLAAVVGQGHIMGTQFHPEKSQQTGLRLIHNFISM